MATFKEALTTSLANFAKSIAKTYPKTANIVDNLLSTDSTLPLSAKQGNVLQTQIDTLNSNKSEIKVEIISITTDEYGVCDFSTDKRVISAYLPGLIAIPYVGSDGQSWKFKILSVVTMQEAANLSSQLWFRYYE